MNQRTPPPAHTPPPAPAQPRTQASVKGRDREFLPAALEILETPPPPVPVALMLTICLFFGAALAWSFFGRLDVHAVAQGTVQRAGRAKVIQPLEPGKIAAIHVAPGDHVKAGDLVLELDPAEAMADATAQRDARNASLAEVARRRAAIEIARSAQREPQASPAASRSTDKTPLARAAADSASRIIWDQDMPEAMRTRESAAFSADLLQLAGALNSLDKQMAQKEATRERLRMSIAFQDKLIGTLTQRVDTRQAAIDLRVGTKINLYDAKEELEKSQSALASDQGQLIETDAAIRLVESETARTIAQFIADNENKLVEAARKADEAREGFAKAEARLRRTKLFAPSDGIVQQLSVTTLGQVVTTGQALVVIAPSEGALQVEALVANLDIGFVKLGQDAVVKVDAFPFTRFGVLHGKVARIAAAAIDEQSAKRALADATTSGTPGAAPAASAPGQPESFVFPVAIDLQETTVKVGDARTPLAPGMTVTVEIKTDSRRVIDYLFSPLAKLASEALREE